MTFTFKQNTSATLEQCLVIHPLDDIQEMKPDLDKIGQMHMRRRVRYSLQALRCYVVVMMGLVAYHVLAVAHVL